MDNVPTRLYCAVLSLLESCFDVIHGSSTTDYILAAYGLLMSCR